MSEDDRTAKARIRDAAVAVIADRGTPALTARRVAERADVSPGLVNHHYGSMDGLQRACDQHVAALIREAKTAAVARGGALDPLAALRDRRYRPLLAYLAQRLSHGSPAVADLVDELVADAEGYMAEAVANGMVRPTEDPRGRATVLVLWSLSALVLHEHMERLLGVDPTDPEVGTDGGLARYLRPALDILGQGVLTDEVAQQLAERLPDCDRDRT